MKHCLWQDCPQGGTMGEYCIRHYYEAQGRVCPGYEPGGEFHGTTRTRPMVSSNRVVYGRQATSRKAADRALPKSGTHRRRIYDYLQLVSGATDEEVELALGISGNSVRPCRVTLVEEGWVKDSGTRRLTRSGNEAIVWVVIP